MASYQVGGIEVVRQSVSLSCMSLEGQALWVSGQCDGLGAFDFGTTVSSWRASRLVAGLSSAWRATLASLRVHGTRVGDSLRPDCDSGERWWWLAVGGSTRRR